MIVKKNLKSIITAQLSVLWGGSDGFSEERRTLLPSNAVNSMAVADFNNDGMLDLFVGSYQDGRQRDIDSQSWIQYKLALGATNSLRTPRLTKIEANLKRE